MATHSQREGQFVSVTNLIALGAARTLALFTCRHAICLSVLANTTCPSPIVLAPVGAPCTAVMFGLSDAHRRLRSRVAFTVSTRTKSRCSNDEWLSSNHDSVAVVVCVSCTAIATQRTCCLFVARAAGACRSRQRVLAPPHSTLRSARALEARRVRFYLTMNVFQTTSTTYLRAVHCTSTRKYVRAYAYALDSQEHAEEHLRTVDTLHRKCVSHCGRAHVLESQHDPTTPDTHQQRSENFWKYDQDSA